MNALTPYNGEWNFETAAHLLRRTTFGATYEEIQSAVDLGLEGTLGELFRTLPEPEPPVYHDYSDDPNAGLGRTWINAPHIDNKSNNARRRSLYGWMFRQMTDIRISVQEKMVLFWLNHFVIQSEVVKDGRFLYEFQKKLRANSLGDFKQLVEQITIDPSMLRYLNGRDNVVDAPNENYARELLELFTVGKGEIAAPGDYTTFTEGDVVQMARVLTGWRDRGYYSRDSAVEVSFFFRYRQHDSGTKQLSHRFNNAVITNNNRLEYLDLINIIFEHPEAARFVVRKLYRWFVQLEITPTVEQEVIEPLSILFRSENFAVQPVLESLFRSAHFYDKGVVGAIIKNPMDFIFSQLGHLNTNFPEDTLFRKYHVSFKTYQLIGNMQMELFNPPDVAGWQAYYKAPQYDQLWISSVTLPLRVDFSNSITSNGLRLAGYNLVIDPFEAIRGIEKVEDPNHLITELAKLLFPNPISEEQHDDLKEVLIPGLPDFEWTVEYEAYKANPQRRDLRSSIERKLKQLIQSMLAMPEFYLQ